LATDHGPGAEQGSDPRIAIREGVAKLGQRLDERQLGQLVTLLGELGRWNRRFNLTAIRDPAETVAGHVLDSLSVRPYLHGPRIIDVGTGAGFPGLPLAVVEPDMHFTLLDSVGKKIRFVDHAIGMLGLANAKAVNARAEDYAPGIRFDTVIARALAAIPRLVRLAGHLVEEGGQFLALKGKYPAEELEAIQSLPEWEYSVIKLSVPGLEAHERHVIQLKRTT